MDKSDIIDVKNVRGLLKTCEVVIFENQIKIWRVNFCFKNRWDFPQKVTQFINSDMIELHVSEDNGDINNVPS